MPLKKMPQAIAGLGTKADEIIDEFGLESASDLGFLKEGDIPYRLRILLLFTKIFPKAKKTRGERLRCALESLGPIFVKFGQLLSTRPDLIPPDICSELSRLQDDVPPFDNEVFMSIVEEALGKKISDLSRNNIRFR